MDLNTGKAHEQGTMSAQSNGKIIRDITAIYSPGTRGIGMPRVGPEGATAHFPEIIKRSSPTRFLPPAMRETNEGWVAAFTTTSLTNNSTAQTME
jgi:hypothetical protein